MLLEFDLDIIKRLTRLKSFMFVTDKGEPINLM